MEELLARLSDRNCKVVMSISPQSIVSIAQAHALTPSECCLKIVGALKAFGVMAVFDIGWARDVALVEAAKEFIERYRSSGKMEKLGVSIPQCQCEGKAHSNFFNTPVNTSPNPLPVLASSCPGWVCYAEKTHGDFVLPFISSSKSPQAVLGTLIKRFWAQEKGFKPGQIFHCSVMPCFDKKLEAARDEFQIEGPEDRVQETDCVLSTSELNDWLTSNYDHVWKSAPSSHFDSPFSNQVPGGLGRYYSVPGGSGGYMEYIFRTAARELFHREIQIGDVRVTQGRNADVLETNLEVEGKIAMRFASIYGFRNIQSLMRKLKRGICEYDYVEVMACPSGCLNGGGQVKAFASEPGVLIEQLKHDYNSGDYLEPRSPESNSSLEQLYKTWVGDMPGSSQAKSILHTTYTKREKTVTSVISDW